MKPPGVSVYANPLCCVLQFNKLGHTPIATFTWFVIGERASSKAATEVAIQQLYLVNLT